MKALFIPYGALLIAIAAEVIATSLLTASQQFTKLWPAVGTVLFYGIAFYCLSVALRVMPVGIAYALWSGLGIVLISVIGLVLFRQALDAPALLGIGLIIAGVIVINVFSRAVSHQAVN